MPISHSGRARLRRLVTAHVEALNAHDLDASMSAFAAHANLLLNGTFHGTSRAIAAAYTRLGFSALPGLFGDLRLVLDREHFTDEQIVCEGRLCGVHSGSAAGFPPATGARLELASVLMYRFDQRDQIIAKHASVDLGPLFRGLYPMPELPAAPTSTASVP